MIMDCIGDSGREISFNIGILVPIFFSLEGIKKGSHVKQKNRSMSTRPTGGQMQYCPTNKFVEMFNLKN